MKTPFNLDFHLYASPTCNPPCSVLLSLLFWCHCYAIQHHFSRPPRSAGTTYCSHCDGTREDVRCHRRYDAYLYRGNNVSLSNSYMPASIESRINSAFFLESLETVAPVPGHQPLGSALEREPVLEASTRAILPPATPKQHVLQLTTTLQLSLPRPLFPQTSQAKISPQVSMTSPP